MMNRSFFRTAALVALFILPASQSLLADELVFLKDDLRGALDRAQREGKLIFLDFWADYCSPCQLMEKYTFTDPSVIGRMNTAYVPVKVDIKSFDGYDLKTQYKVTQLPTLIILDSKGRQVARYEKAFTGSQLAAMLDKHNLPQYRARVASPSTVNAGYNTATGFSASTETRPVTTAGDVRSAPLTSYSTTIRSKPTSYNNSVTTKPTMPPSNYTPSSPTKPTAPRPTPPVVNAPNRVYSPPPTNVYNENVTTKPTVTAAKPTFTPAAKPIVAPTYYKPNVLNSTTNTSVAPAAKPVAAPIYVKQNVSNSTAKPIPQSGSPSAKPSTTLTYSKLNVSNPAAKPSVKPTAKLRNGLQEAIPSSGFTVQFNYFKQLESMEVFTEQMVRKYPNQPVYVLKGQSEQRGETAYRVVVGHFQTHEEAADFKTRIGAASLFIQDFANLRKKK